MDFFVLRWPQTIEQTTTNYNRIGPENFGDAPRCHYCHQVIGMLPWLPPYRVELVLFGGKFGDITFGGGSDLLVSERFVDHYRRAGLIGMEGFDPVEVAKVKPRNRRLQEAPKYFRVLPVISNAAIDDEASEVVREKAWTCSECRTAGIVSLERIVFEARSWSGEDVFYARGLPGIIIVSSRFEQLYRASQLTGAELIPALKYHYDMYDWSFLSKLK